MSLGRRLIVGALGAVGLFVAVQIGALLLVSPFIDAGFQAVDNPNNPVNSGVYIGAILVATVAILAVIKLRIQWVLRVIVTVIAGILSLYVFLVIVPSNIPFASVIPWVLAGIVSVVLYLYPEWWVIDSVGVIIGAGGAGLFGISFGPLPAILLLGGLAIYDAISVYHTKHMLTLAESMTELKLPLVLIVPVSLSYSFLADNPINPALGSDEREAFFIGLGDAVMPSILVASAAVFSHAPMLDVPIIVLNLPAVFTMVGTLLGLLVLVWLVEKGRAHAGLPLLNGGAIGGYLVGSMVVGIGIVDAVGLTPFI